MMMCFCRIVFRATLLTKLQDGSTHPLTYTHECKQFSSPVFTLSSALATTKNPRSFMNLSTFIHQISPEIYDLRRITKADERSTFSIARNPFYWTLVCAKKISCLAVLRQSESKFSPQNCSVDSSSIDPI